MARRRLLGDEQWAALFALPAGERDVVGVWGATERKTHVRTGDGRTELIADDVKFLMMGDEQANCIRDRHCHLVGFH